jgi:hypothetical protein
LIFVGPQLPPGGAARWLSFDEVVWNGPPSVVSKVVLKRTYFDLETFFRTQLGIPDSPSRILLDELILLTRSESGSSISDEDHWHISRILKDISDIIAQNGRDETTNPPWISELVAYRIFPVRLASTRELQLRKLDEKKFYIPDRSGLLFGMFGSQVDMLELEKKISFSRIQPLLDNIQEIGSHYLDVAVSRTFSCVGERVRDIETQECYRMRASLISR